MKIIFLDFDGVITTYYSHWNIDTEKLELIDEIIQETDAKIVVSSSWIHGSDNAGDFKSGLDSNSYAKNVKNQTQFDKFVSRIYDITDGNGPWRGDEIQRWLDEHDGDIESYVILDDDDDFRDEQLFNFVQTDGYEGITSREVKLCVGILNNKKIQNPIRLNYKLKTKWINLMNGTEINNIKDLLSKYHSKWKNYQ